MVKQHGYSSVASTSLAVAATTILLFAFICIVSLRTDEGSDQMRMASVRSDTFLSGEADNPAANSLLVAEQLDEARSIANQMVQSHPDNAAYLRSLAEIAVRQGDYRTAFECYEKAVKVSPEDITLRGMGLLYQRLGRHQEALAILERARDLAPESVETLEALAASCLHCDKVSRASQLADTMFAIAPDAPGGHVIKMFAALAEGRTSEASEHYRQFKQLGRHRSDYDELVGMYDSTLR